MSSLKKKLYIITGILAGLVVLLLLQTDNHVSDLDGHISGINNSIHYTITHSSPQWISNQVTRILNNL